MALVVDCICDKCGIRWRGATGSGRPAPRICGECSAKERDQKRREHFGALDALTLEERVRKIEEWIYAYRPPSTEPMRF